MANPVTAMVEQEVKTDSAWPIGVCTSVKNAALLEKAGVQYIEANVQRLLVPQKPTEEFAKSLEAVKACPLPVTAANCFIPGSLKSVGPDADHAKVLAYAKTAFERAAKVGIRHIVFGSSGSRSIPDGFEKRDAELQFVALLARMAPLAEAHDVIVVIEPLNRKETNFINTLLEGARLVEPVDHPNIRLLADIYHMMRVDDPPEHIRKTKHLLHHIHIAEKEKRTPPGKMGDDFKPFLRELAEAGYKGGISMECRWSNMEDELPTAVSALRKQMSDLADE